MAQIDSNPKINTYYEKRLQQLGITEEVNKIGLLKYNADTGQNEIVAQQIFRKHDKGIEIIVYNLQRETFRIEKEGSKIKKDWSIIRLENPIVKADGDTIKYLMPKGHGSFPFLPPGLIEKFENKKQVQTLFLTEGFFKAFKSSMAGVDIIGLASITHLKDKSTGALHPDIKKVIETCGVQRLVWLTDGDALDLSSKADGKEKVDLYKRPSSFFASINTFKQLTDDYADVQKYWFHVDTENILQRENFLTDLQNRVTKDGAKGVDDIMVSFPNSIPAIVADMQSVSEGGAWFQKFNITFGLGKVRSYFRIDNVNSFYLYHLERNAWLKGKEFIFHGTRYRYNDEKGDCEVMVPEAANNYFRVGDNYLKFVHIPNKYKQLERTFHNRRKGTIIDDHGKDLVRHIPKYEAYCNVPDHTNFQQVMNNCFNVYNPLEHEPEEEECTAEDCSTILSFIKHIFGESTVHFTHPENKEKRQYSMFELGLDYIQLLYQRPTEKLPILCLVSKENNTGKSTMGKLLKIIFGGNCAVVGNQDLAGDFNSHWATKLVVVCDETKIDKQNVIEKVKSLSTADKIMMNAKGKDHVEIDCFIKFIFITNNEDNFIYASEDDIRYWVIKVPVISKENPTLLDNMLEEVPALLNYLNRRKLVTERLNRMWFHPTLLRTEALKKVIQYSRPVIEKELRQHLKEMFLDFGVQEILMSRLDIQEQFFRGRFEANYIEKVLKESMKIDMYHTLDPGQPDLMGNPKKIYKVRRYSFPKLEYNPEKKEKIRTEAASNGRPYVFHRADFVNVNEEVEISAEAKYLAEMVSNNDRPDHPGKLDELPF